MNNRNATKPTGCITAAAGLALIVTTMTACAQTQTTDTRIGTLKFFDGVTEEAAVGLFLGLYASAKFTLTGRDIETRFVRKSGQEQHRRSNGKKEITF